MKIDLPPKKYVSVTNEEDPLKYYYLPVAGWFYKKRLKDVLSSLGDSERENLLEVGFGAGIFFPELKKRCRNIYGLEVHDKTSEVYQSMSDFGIETDLKQGDILNMPYQDDFFDVVVSVSTLEHIKDLNKASDEITRILKPGGVAVLGFPVRNIITDMIFRICGNNPRDIHPSSHRDILKAFNEKMILEEIIKLPDFLPMDFGLYVSARFKKNNYVWNSRFKR